MITDIVLHEGIEPNRPPLLAAGRARIEPIGLSERRAAARRRDREREQNCHTRRSDERARHGLCLKGGEQVASTRAGSLEAIPGRRKATISAVQGRKAPESRSPGRGWPCPESRPRKPAEPRDRSAAGGLVGGAEFPRSERRPGGPQQTSGDGAGNRDPPPDAASAHPATN